MSSWDCYGTTHSTWIPGSRSRFVADCSIQVSEILKHQGSLAEAADLIGIFYYINVAENRTGIVLARLRFAYIIQSSTWNDTIAI
jgi:hypothetical protein